MKKTLTLLLALLLVGCSKDGGTLIEEKTGWLVTTKAEFQNQNPKVWKYVILSDDGISYTFYTQSEFKLGDFVEVTKKGPWP